MVLTNGHGEDQIARQLIDALRRRSAEQGIAPPPVVVLPLVGQGQAFAAAEARGLLQRQGPRQT
ncbi:MAG: sugar synthetase, partial [Cyanobium sp.]